MVKIQGKLGGGLEIKQECFSEAEMEFFCHLVAILCYSNSYFFKKNQTIFDVLFLKKFSNIYLFSKTDYSLGAFQI